MDWGASRVIARYVESGTRESAYVRGGDRIRVPRDTRGEERGRGIMSCTERSENGSAKRGEIRSEIEGTESTRERTG